MASSNKDTILRKLEQEFEKFYKKYGEPPVRNLKSVTSKTIKRDMKTWGIFIIGDATSKEAYRKNKRENIRELSNHLFHVPDPHTNKKFQVEYERISKKYPHFTKEEKDLATMISGWWRAEEGFGNMNFRFLYFQFLQQNPSFGIGDEQIDFSRNPFHRHQLRLLADKPRLWELLKSQHKSGVPMVSWDSQKVRFHDAGVVNKIGRSKQFKPAAKPGLTKRHSDIYKYGGADMDRIQAMLIEQSPKAISLGWVIFSNRPSIRKLIAEYFGKEPGGFSSVEDEKLNPILDKYWRGPLGGFIIWSQATIHYEALPDPKTRKFKSFSQPTENLREFSFRAVIGTHTPVDLGKKELYQLAHLAEYGYAPAIYKGHHNNKGTNVNKNVVNPKSTQWNIARKPRGRELFELNEAELGYAPKRIREHVNALPRIIREMYGIYDISSIAKRFGMTKKDAKHCVQDIMKEKNLDEWNVIRGIMSLQRT